MPAKNVKETRVYKLAFELAMGIFELTKQFPKEEKYSLIDQIRRSSRSVCICLIEAYRKKRYVAHFVSKVTDSDSENSETSGWLDFSLACKSDWICFQEIDFKIGRSGATLTSHDQQPRAVLMKMKTYQEDATIRWATNKLELPVARCLLPVSKQDV